MIEYTNEIEVSYTVEYSDNMGYPTCDSFGNYAKAVKFYRKMKKQNRNPILIKRSVIETEMDID